MMKLSDVPDGTTVRIYLLSSRPDLSLRLRELGFYEDQPLRMISSRRGRVICEILNTRIGIDGPLAGEILVTGHEQQLP
jgi:Fe2+ transport system protein FeoA